MKFADLREGMVITAGPVKVEQEEILEFARKYDPQWFHTDLKRAETGRWGGLISSGWMTCGLAMRLVAETILRDSECYGSPGLSALHWRAPVRPGDELSLEARVNEIRQSSSRPGLGIVQWTWRMRNQRGEAVLELEVTNLFDLSGQG
ncbi:MAG: MaoC family dehydratase [Burkholderiaceae bacterium]|jgi:acyl dehydratase|nr:MaoC family dehydratase [Burkholderiaceae bacterium]